MLKLYHESDNGDNKIVGLGLSEGNIQLLKQDKPIMFSCKSARINLNGEIVIAYASKALRDAMGVAKPGLWTRKDTFLFILDDDSMKKLVSGQCIENICPDVKFVMFCGKDELTMRKQFSGLIGPSTVVISEGFAPGDNFGFTNPN